MIRHKLTDEQWEWIADLFPPAKPLGRPRRDRRQIVDGILWIMRTGSPWRDLPAEFGPWATVWDSVHPMERRRYCTHDPTTSARPGVE